MIENKVAASELLVIDLKTLISDEETLFFDLKDYLYRGLILKEKEYRAALDNIELDKYINKTVLVFCSADVIIPVWAYMLVAVYLSPIANKLIFSNEVDWRKMQITESINNLNIDEYVDKRVIIKGCGDISIPEVAFFEITKKLLPVVKSIMYGEPCSTVPIFKRKKS